MADATEPTASAILGTLQTGVLVIDPDGKVKQVNAGSEMMLNVSAAHLINRPLSTVIELPPGYSAANEAVFSAYDVVLSKNDRPLVRADFVATPFADWPGWRLITLHEGATAHRMGRRAGGGGARTAVGIAAMLAHEIKNPLSGISGAAQLLSTRVSENDARMTTLIRTEVDRITALIDRMEGFTDTRALTLAADNIHSIIDHARSVALSGFGRELTVTDSFDPSLPAVLTHRDSMIQIILNLLKNSAETATPQEQRKILLTTAFRHGVSVALPGSNERMALPIEVCIIDDGPGVPPEIVENLFDPFVSTKKSGRGLGLALVDKLVRDMGGLIQYSREGNPQQTVFRLLLPRAERTKS
jgi:two-component system, NtrC family, nitrogen regulation sensor histidine kinase GlnL